MKVEITGEENLGEDSRQALEDVVLLFMLEYILQRLSLLK